MNLSVLINNRFFDYLENIKSENLGFYFSFFLHLLILLCVIGLPNFFGPKPVSIPVIIPIEIINVTEFDTSIPKETSTSQSTKNKKITLEEKKFNSSDNQEIKKIDIKEKPKVVKEKIFNSSDNQEIKKIDIKEKPKVVKEKIFNSSDNQEIKKINIKEKPEIKNDEVEKKITQKEISLINQKENIVIKERKEVPIQLEKEKIAINIRNFESLPSKKIRPKLKPKTNEIIQSQEQRPDVVAQIKPKPKPKKKWDLATAMKDISEDQSTFSADQDVKDIKQEEIIADKEYKEIDKETERKAIISLANAVRQQYYECWSNNSGKLKDVGVNEFVTAYARYTKKGRVIENTIQIRDTNIGHKTILINEVKYALYTCRLNLPEKFFYLWEDMIIHFDYNAMNKEIIGIKQKKLNLFN